MLEPRRIEMDVQPDLIEKLGNGTYYYNYDIKSKRLMLQTQKQKM